ncbi:hybrid sensor histidine kinase/response regulator [Marilutibacter chinensis]|uniref:histidine kinase n=1 Tax=Marilutibacter chinensis TaxID=2912247 RepID=A0ABS9HWU1_9GAMM|nr:ATP-binding protein [Lysobacter chinensis]MCF7222517.1 ATP-binding protein [Lysobacter chinensis]
MTTHFPRGLAMLLAVAFAWLASWPLPLRAAMPDVPRVRVIGVEHGLPASYINGIAEDRDGYIWLATTDGLARYDGAGMRVWRHDPADPDGLPGNLITYVHVDDRNRVWAAVETRGLSVLEADRKTFRHYRMDQEPRIGSDDTFAIASRPGEVWFGTYGGGLHRLAADGRITRFMPQEGDPASLPSTTVTSLAFDGDGTLWIGTLAGLARWNGQAIERVPVPGEVPAPLVYSVSPRADGLWVGADSGVYRRVADGHWDDPKWSAMFAKPNAVLSVVNDLSGHLWLGTQRSVWKVAPGEIPVPVQTGAHGPTRAIQQLLMQDNGALWLPVPGRGLGYLRPDWRDVTQLTHGDGGLTSSLYLGMAPSADGGLWMMGERGELDYLDESGIVHPISEATRAALTGWRPISIVEDDRGRLWLGTAGLFGNLLRIDGDGVVRGWAPEDDTDATPGGAIPLMKQAPDGTIWLVASGGGMQQRDPDSGRVLANIPAGPDGGLDTVDVEDLGFDPDGVPWVAADAGILRLAADGRRFEPVPGLAGDRVYGFDFEGPDHLWLQRLAGLERYRRDGDRWVPLARVGAEHEIPAIEGRGLHVDVRGRVWLATARGLYRWDHQAGRLRRFGLADGLSSHQFVDHSTVLTPDGLLAGALDDGGVVLVDSSAGDPPPLQPRLQWDAVEVRRDGRWRTVGHEALQALTAADRELRMQFRLMAFDDPEAIRYFTRLDGYDPDWVGHGSRGEREFSGLAPGSYTLRARADDALGNASAEQILHFTVQPPWWNTPAAWAGFGGLAVLLLWWASDVYRDRLRQLHARERAEHEREIATQASLAKTRFLATLGHEVRTPMTGVLGMSELLLGTDLDAEQREFAESIKQAGEHLLRLVNDALDLARIESGKLELMVAPFELERLLREVVGLNAPLARAKGLEFVSRLSGDLPRRVDGDAKRVRQILLNLLGNAIKFTAVGHVGLHVARDAGGGLRFTVEDTGPGLSEEQQGRLFRRFEQAEGARTADRYGGSGLGLAICHELVEAMGGRIEVDSAPGRGARFHVVLPFAESAAATANEAGTAGTAATASPPTPMRALDLLLVEDDATVADVLAGLLRAQGHRVVHAEHGLAALAEVATASAKTTGFDAALLDLDLPGMDGLSLARQLRVQGFHAPLIAITARADVPVEQQALQAGFDRFVRKPVTGAMLAELLAAVTREPSRPSA